MTPSPRRVRRRLRPSVAALVLAALVLAALAASSACDGDAAAAAAQADASAPVPHTSIPTADDDAPRDAAVQWVDVEAPLSFPAQLHVDGDVVLAARTDGVLGQLRVDLGSSVRAGELLTAIESEAQQLALARAEAVREDAARALARVQALMRSRSVTTADSETVASAARMAEIGLSEARRQLALTRVTAPFDAVVAARYVGPYRLVHAGDTLFRLTARGPLLARVRVPEMQALSVAVGAPAVVIGPDGSESTARIAHIAPAVDAASGTRELVLSVADAPRLRVGSAVTVRLGSTRRRVLVVPREMVGDDGYTLVVEAGRPTLRAVRLGADVGEGRVEVLSGLAAGERVRRPER